MGSMVASRMGASPDTVAALEDFAVKFNGLSLNPNPNLAPMLERRQARREQGQTRNQTAAYLQKAGRPDLAQLVQAGALDGSGALQMAMKQEKPEIFNMGNELVMIDPVTREPKVVYREQGGDGAKEEIFQSGDKFFRRGEAGMEMLPVNGMPAPDPNASPTLEPEKEATVGGSLRDDLNAQLKSFRDSQEAFAAIETYYKAPRTAGTTNPDGTPGAPQSGSVADYALATSFVKLLDPDSVAREGEVNAVARSGSIPSSLRAYLMAAVGGTGQLPQGVRDEIYRLSQDVYDRRASAAAKLVKGYEQSAADLGVRRQIVNPLGRIPQRAVLPMPPKPPAPTLPISPEEEAAIGNKYGGGL